MSDHETRTQQILERMSRWAHHRWVPPLSEPRREPLLAVPRGEIGSCWRLPVPAWFIEWPRGNTTLTLSAVADGARADLAAGTRLRLVEIDDLADVRGGDLVTWITYYEDWETRTYVVGDGPRAGQRIMFSGNPAGGRFPRSSVLAHAALEPTGEDEPL